MTSQRSRLGKLVASVLVGAVALAACGSGESDGGEAADAEPAVVVPDEVEVLPVADVATNLLPDLIVDNLNDDNKVNLRNFGVGDKPILLWMYAPH